MAKHTFGYLPRGCHWGFRLQRNEHVDHIAIHEEYPTQKALCGAEVTYFSRQGTESRCPMCLRAARRIIKSGKWPQWNSPRPKPDVQQMVDEILEGAMA